jgi:hypothetical protein
MAEGAQHDEHCARHQQGRRAGFIVVHKDCRRTGAERAGPE